MEDIAPAEEKTAHKKHTSDKMRDMSIPRLLMVMSLPAMLSMLVQALYNVMDTVYVGMYYSAIGEAEYIAATQALSVAFPIQLIVTSIGLGIGIGANAIISKRLGEGDRHAASRAATMAILMVLVAAAAMCLIGGLMARPFVAAVADASGEGGMVIEYGTQYLFIVAAFSAGQTLELTGTRILQGTGNMKIPMIAQIVGAGINIALDPLFLFVFGMGVRGAAIATVISQFCAMGISYAVLLFFQHEVKISFIKVKIDKESFFANINIGIPSFVMNAVGAVTYISLLALIKAYGFGGVFQQILGLYFRLNSLAFMPIFGLMQGLLPILGYSYGANKKERFVHVLKLSLSISVALLLAGTVLFEVAPAMLLGLFSAGDQTIRVGVPALRIVAISFPFAAVGINLINVFQSLQCGIRSLIMSVFRQVGIIIPFAAVFGMITEWAIWAAYPVSEIVTMLVFLPQVFFVIKSKFKEKDEQSAGDGERTAAPRETARTI